VSTSASETSVQNDPEDPNLATDASDNTQVIQPLNPDLIRRHGGSSWRTTSQCLTCTARYKQPGARVDRTRRGRNCQRHQAAVRNVDDMQHMGRVRREGRGADHSIVKSHLHVNRRNGPGDLRRPSHACAIRLELRHDGWRCGAGKGRLEREARLDGFHGQADGYRDPNPDPSGRERM